MNAAEQGGGAADGHAYLQNPIWWAGMSTMIVGEVANFAAYTFAPPILVTPLGALSVLIGAVLASFILKEELGRLGRVGCTLCLVGTVIIIMNAPEDQEIKTVDEMLNYAIQTREFVSCSSTQFTEAFSTLTYALLIHSFSHILPLCDWFRHLYDLARGAQVREANTDRLHLHLQSGRLYLGHERQGFRSGIEADARRQ